MDACSPPPTREQRERGSALLLVTLVIVSLSAALLVVLQDGLTRVRLARHDRDAIQALALAESGLALKLNELDRSAGGALDPVELQTPEGRIRATVSQEGEYLRIQARGTVHAGGPREFSRTVEAYLRTQFHPLFYRATYVGNEQERPGYRLTLGPDGVAEPEEIGGGVLEEGDWLPRWTSLSESWLQVDLNADGDTFDVVGIRDIWRNRRAWGWDPPGSDNFVFRPHNRYYQLDIDRDGRLGDYQAPTVVLPPHFRDPADDADPEEHQPVPWWAVVEPTTNADYVEGDVYVNGDVDLTGMTDVFGNVDATGEVRGLPLQGAAASSAARIAPPNLQAMHYERIADRVVEPGNLPSWMMGQQGSSYYGGDLGPSDAHDNAHFHLGNQSGYVGFDADETDMLVLVRGNLWLHSTSSYTIDTPGNRDHRVTFVVEGNLYVADDLEYGTEDSGMLFIVKTNDENPESYLDENRNYRYDPGEPIIDDDGDGVYEGPREGQGNVFFGDPRYGSGGVTDGFIYAENNVHLVNPPLNVNPPSGQDTIFGVEGFLSAGGIMDLGWRDWGDDFINFRVRYDDRIESGELSFPGMPAGQGGGYQGLSVVSWRELR